ncbi:MAG: SAM-dependent methyltransferase, partial [Gammaproteobacteria bacterium]
MKSPRLSIALISAAALAYEILLTRLFSIIHWHHFAYMIISLALLGFGASGAFISFAQRSLVPRFPQAYIANATLFGLTSIACFLLAQRLPFSALQIMWDVSHWGWLLLIYLLLFIPFFFAANCICLALATFPAQISRTYAYDLAGAGLGALGIVIVLSRLAPLSALQVVSCTGLAAAVVAALEDKTHRRLPLAVFLLAGAVSMPLWPQPDLEISEYKALSQQLRIPGARIVDTEPGPRGLVAVLESPQVPLRYAPGISVSATAELPNQLGVYTDANGPTAVTHYDGRRDQIAFVDQLTSAAPYHLQQPSRVLLLASGGGMGILQAIYHGASAIEAVEPNRQIAEQLTRTQADFAGWEWLAEHVLLHIDEPRGFVARTGEQYDLIQLGLPNSPIASNFAALSENHLFTVEATRAYLARLNPGGLLAVTTVVQIPPRTSLRVLGVAIDALQSLGATNPEQRIVLIRGWQTATLLVKNGELTPAELDTLTSFCNSRSFDLAYHSELVPEQTNRFNILQQPYFYDATRALLSEARQDFVDQYKFDITPATDDRPYFSLFFRWSALPEMLALRGQGGLPLVQWAYPVLLATLVQAFAISLLLILVPAAALQRTHERSPGALRIAVYFLAIGLAFLFIEIAFIQKFTLLLGHPVFAFGTVLAAFLIFAGAGSQCSQRLAPGWRACPFAGIALIAGIYIAVLPQFLPTLSALGLYARFAAAIALIAPLAFLMGMPFPLGLSRLAARAPAHIPWAWALNG